MNILIGMLGQESNAFAKEHCNMARFAPNGIVTEAQFMAEYRLGNDYPGGMIRAAEEQGVQVVPTLGNLTAGPMLTDACLAEITAMLLDHIQKHRQEIQGICLALHGAGRGETVLDLEGHMLESIREIVGPNLPMVITLDLHANMTEKMILLTQGIFGIKEYPHTDKAAAGYLAMNSLIRQIRGEAPPEIGFVRLPLLIPPTIGSTLELPVQEIKDYVIACREQYGLTDASFFHGFPYADTPDAMASVVTLGPAGSGRAQAAAADIAEFVWQRRQSLVPRVLSAAEAVNQALAVSAPGYVVINESSDNPGGGAPGDGTGLLAAMLAEDKVPGIFGSIYDPSIVALALEAGLGGRISGSLGAKTDDLHGDPIPLRDALVCCLSQGVYHCNSPVQAGMAINMGPTVRLRVGKTDIVVTSIMARQTYCDGPFIAAGADLRHYRLVGLKSSNHFKAFFQSRAAAIIPADPPGIQTARFDILPFRHIPQQVYPLDKTVVYDGLVRVYP